MKKSNATKQKRHRLGITERLDNINAKLNTLVDYVNGSKISYETEIEVLREMNEQLRILNNIPDLKNN